MKKQNLKNQNGYVLNQNLIGIILIILLIFIAYWPALNFDFVNWDDPYYVYKNEIIKRLNANTFKILFSTQTIVMGNWHPLTLLSLAIDHALWGLNPGGYHFTNILLHAGNSVLAGILVFQFWHLRLPALFTSIAFALHPLHIESVVWITERKDVLFTFFFFLSWVYWNRREKGSGTIVLSLLFFIAACLSKAMAVSLPVILLLTEYMKGNKIAWKQLSLFFLFALILGLMGIYAQNAASALKYQEGYSWFDNFQVAGTGVWFYVMKLIWPWPLSAFYPYPEKVDGALPFYYMIGFIASLALLAVTVFLMYKQKRLAVFFIAFFLITLFPVSQLIPLGDARAADRYMYLSSWSFFACIAYCTHYLYKKYAISLYIVMGLTVLLFLIWFGMVRYRLPAWESGKSLWEDVISKNPDLYFAWNNLGTLYYDKQEYDLAIPVFRRVLEINPEYKDGHNNLGTIYATREQLDSAIYHFEKAVAIDSEYTAALFNLGYAYGLQNRGGESVILLKKAAVNGHENARMILKNNDISWTE